MESQKIYMSASRLPGFVPDDGQHECDYISGLHEAVKAPADPEEIRRLKPQLSLRTRSSMFFQVWRITG